MLMAMMASVVTAITTIGDQPDRMVLGSLLLFIQHLLSQLALCAHHSFAIEPRVQRCSFAGMVDVVGALTGDEYLNDASIPTIGKMVSGRVLFPPTIESLPPPPHCA